MSRVIRLDNGLVHGKVFFISDTHFHHRNINELAGRPFNSMEEHDETIISNWNGMVTDKDTIFVLGDFCFGNNDKIKKMCDRLNGRKILIRGNHDKNNTVMVNSGFIHCSCNLLWSQYYMIHNCYKIGNHLFEKSHKILMSGHTHSTSKINYTKTGRPTLNLSLDAWDWKPIPLNVIKEHLYLLP